MEVQTNPTGDVSRAAFDVWKCPLPADPPRLRSHEWEAWQAAIAWHNHVLRLHTSDRLQPNSEPQA